MKASELRAKTSEELTTQLVELHREAFTLRMQKAANQLTKPHLVGQVRKDIARVNLVLSEKARG